jgi:hypothetical protein
MKNFIIAALTCTLGSCTSVKVVKVTNGNEQGIRYSLGRPYIQVTPNASGDGSYSVEVIYLPDKNQTYAVQTSTFLAKNIMEVTVDEYGILKKIDWTGATDATVSESAKALGEVTKAEIERQTKKEEEEEKEALAKKQAVEDEIEKLEAERAQKKLDLQIAKKDLASMEVTYRGSARTTEVREKMRQMRLLIDRLGGEIDILDVKLRDAKSMEQDISAAFNDPAAGNEETAYGPVLFQIIEGSDPENPTLTLKAVNWTTSEKQMQFRTIAKVGAATPAPKSPKITSEGRISVNFQADVAIIEFDFDSEIERINGTISDVTSETSGTNPDFTKIGVELKDKKKVKLTIKRQDMPAGQYTLNIAFSYKVGSEEKEGSQPLIIELLN